MSNPPATTTGTPVKLDPVVSSDEMRDNGVPRYVSTKHMCITGMKTYSNKSLEELRVEDYIADRKAPQAGSTGFTFGSTSTVAGNNKGNMFPASQLGAGGGERSRAAPRRRLKSSQLGGLTLFGSATVHPNSGSSDAASSPFTFGSATTVNTTSSSLFGGGEQAKQQSSPFLGAKPSTGFLFGSGAPVTVTSSSVGTDSAQSNSVFGKTTQTTTFASVLGSTMAPIGAKAASEQNSGFLFGAVTSPAPTPSFGSSKSTGLFTSSAQQSGGAFGSKPATGVFSFGFGSRPAQPPAGTAASPGGWLFGSNTDTAAKPLFGSTTTLGIDPESQPAQAQTAQPVTEGPSKTIEGEGEFKAQCSGCGYWEPMERARICDTCSKARVLDEKDVVSEQEKMAQFVFCSSCAIDEHMGKGHQVSKYLPWKNRLLMNACSEAARGRVNNIGDLCMSEWENGRKLLDEWKEAVSFAVETGNALSTAMRCKILAGNCDRHANTIYEELDGKVLPTLRAFSQTLRTATDDLKTDTTCALFEEQVVQNAEEPETTTKEAEAEITNSQPSEATEVVEPATKEAEVQNVEVAAEKPKEPNKEDPNKKPEDGHQQDAPGIVPVPAQVSAHFAS